MIGAAIRSMLNISGASGTDRVAEYERFFAQRLFGRELPCVAFWRGRVALWTILRAMCGVGDEVIIPAYTCEMVPIAVRFAGARCVYADVAPGGYLSTPMQWKGLVTPNTRAVMAQHTYGTPIEAESIWRFQADTGLPVLEDCCHVMDFSDGAGLAGAAAFFSMQWNKPFTTGLGGMAAFSDATLAERVRAARDAFSAQYDRGRAKSLSSQMLAYRLTVRPLTRHLVAAMYRWAQKTGMVKGTSSSEEYQSEMPADYPARALNVQADFGMRALARWEQNVQHRRQLTQFYLAELERMGVNTSALRGSMTHPALWTVPVRVSNKSELLLTASRGHLPIATWFGRLPVHVDTRHVALYGYTPGSCPNAERLFEQEVHLQTSPDVTMKKARAAVEMLGRTGKLCQESS